MQLHELQLGELIDNKYRIEKHLGKGGMGSVYLATHVGTERPVALKVISTQFMLNEEFVARFQREARAAGRLRHPNVVDVTDFGFAQAGAGRVAYLVMEYLDGCSLDEVLAEESRLPIGWVIDILEQVCSAVDEAHQQGIIHRDLKPDNIWLEPNHRGGYTVKVLDFGLAKLSDTSVAGATSNEQAVYTPSTISLSPQLPENAEVTLRLPAAAAEISEAVTQILPANAPTATAPAKSSAIEDEQTLHLPVSKSTDEALALATAPDDGLTRVGSVMGTPSYMSPEQCRGEALDPRSDIYSLGVIAYQMLTGETPFQGDALTIIQKHIAAEPPPIRSKRRSIPRRFANQIMRALAKNPAERPASAAAFASTLRAYSLRPGNLVRQSISLLSEHYKLFIRLGLIVFSPLIFFTLLTTMFEWMIYYESIRREVGNTVIGFSRAIIGVLDRITTIIHLGITSRMVTQMLAAPLRPVSLRPAFAALKQRLWPFITTQLRAWFWMILGMLMLVIPGLLMAFSYCLIAPVVMIENICGKKALQRSKELTRRTKRMVIIVLVIQFILPAITGTILTYLIRAVLKDMSLNGVELAKAFLRVYPVVDIPLKVLLITLSSILTSLLYLVTRQAGGETLKQTLGLFEEEELPVTRWQRRMRERLSSGTTARR